MNNLVEWLYNPNIELPNDPSFYHQILEMIESNSLSPQVYQILLNQGRLESTPTFFKERLNRGYLKVVYQNIFIKSQVIRILEKLNLASVGCIPLKGIHFAEKYFGSLGARATSDIDILVKKRDVKLASEIVISLGFTVEEKFIPYHFHQSFSKEIPGSQIPLTVEIHWDILKNASSKLKIEELWREAQPMKGYSFIKELSDYHTFYMICLHGWRHNLDSKKHYMDIIHLIHILKDKIKYEDLFEDAKNHCTLRRIKRTLTIVYEAHPILDSVVEFPEKNRYSLKGRGNSRLDQYINFVEYQFLSFDTYKHRLFELLNWLVPKRFEVLVELNRDHVQKSYILMLVQLYKQRIIGGSRSS